MIVSKSGIIIIFIVDDRREDALETGGLDLVIVPGLGFTKVSIYKS